MHVLSNVRRVLLSLAVCWFCLSLPVTAQPPAAKPAQPALSPSGQMLDDDFAASVKAWTTRPEFSSPLVDHLPKIAGVPAPKDVLGYHIGQPKKLTHTSGEEKNHPG